MKVLVLTLSYFFFLRPDIADSKKPKPRPCPPRIDIDGVLYRFVGVDKYAPCKGDIHRCIYSSYWFEYCMNGNFPYYKPQRLPIRPYENDEEESGGGSYERTNIGKPSSFATPFNMSTIMNRGGGGSYVKTYIGKPSPFATPFNMSTINNESCYKI